MEYGRHREIGSPKVRAQPHPVEPILRAEGCPLVVLRRRLGLREIHFTEEISPFVSVQAAREIGSLVVQANLKRSAGRRMQRQG